MCSRCRPKKSWAALYGMRCDEAGILREQIKPNLRPDLLTDMRLWRLWGVWLREIDNLHQKYERLDQR